MTPLTRKRTGTAPQVTPAPLHRSPGFTAHIRGDVHASIDGGATITAMRAVGRGSRTFRLLLGPLSAQGCILLSWTSRPLRAGGIYSIGRGEASLDGIRGQVVLGPVERPLVELRARSGMLRILAAGSGLVGSFALEAEGLPGGSKPMRVWVSGDFMARAG